MGGIDMAQRDSKEGRRGVLSRTGSLLRRRPEVLVVDDYHIGDIDAEKTVYVATGAAIAGNITAPKIEVAGLVYGFVACNELLVDVEGQLWGDAYTASLRLKQGGKANGWVCTLDEGTIDLLRSGELALRDLPSEKPGTIPLALRSFLADREKELSEIDADGAAERVLVWRQLQSEAATALLARIELENTFEQRTDEMAREAVLGSATLLGELVQTQGELAVLQGRMEQLQKVVQLHDEKTRTQSAPATRLAEMSAVGSDTSLGNGELAALLREQKQLCETYESEIKSLRQKVELQNSYLTRFQKALKQRKEELKRVRTIEARQASQLAAIKEQASSRIRALEAELALARGKLNSLNAQLNKPESSN